MTGYITLYLICLFASITHLGLISKRYSVKLAPFILNGKIDWNPNIDKLKLMLTSVFFICPLILFKTFTEFNFENLYINYIGLSFIIILIIYCIWFDIKKVNHMKENKIFGKNDSTKKNNYIKETSEKLSELENNSIITSSKVDNYHQEVIGLKKQTITINKNILEVTKETKKNKSDFDKVFNEVKEKINQNKADSNKKFKETNDEISKIKDKAKPKKRDTLKRRENINRIESEFKILISDLNKFPNYERKQKVLSYKKDKLTDLQTYQILLLFFQNKYNFNPKNTNEIIYSLFNKYFGNLTDIKKGDITIMNKGNWKEYKLRKHLTDVENEELYSQLNLYIKR